MISFRFHVVTVVGILFALAAGVVLGAGLYDTDGTAGSTDQSALTSQLAEARESLSAAETRLAGAESYISGVAGQTVRGSLAGRSVILVVAPGASSETVAALARLVPAGGGTLVGRVDLGDDLVDAASRQLVDQLGSQLASSTKGVKVPAGLTGYARFGFLLARAVTTKTAAGAQLDQTATALLAGLKAGQLASVSGDLRRRASLVLLVGPAETPEDGAAAATILQTIAGQLRTGSGGVLVVADSVDGDPAAVVEAVRDSDTLRPLIATEDSGETSAGRVVALLGLAAAARGSVGHFGFGASATAVAP